MIELKGKDVRTLTGRVLTTDGKWQPFMTVEFSPEAVGREARFESRRSAVP